MLGVRYREAYPCASGTLEQRCAPSSRKHAHSVGLDHRLPDNLATCAARVNELSPWHPAKFATRLLDSAGEGIVVFDRELRYRIWNRFMEARSGLSAGQVIGKISYELFPDLLRQGDVDDLRRALSGERVEGADTRFGSESLEAQGWLSGRYEPYIDDDGSIVGVVAHLRDVTERKHTEELAQRREQHLRTIIESASDLVSILDREGRTRYASPSFASVLGLASSDLIATNPLDRIHPADSARVLDAFRAVVRAPQSPQRVQYRVRHANGGWRVLVSSARNLLGDPSVGGIVVASRDITDWQELQEQLHLSKKIEAVGRLAGGVAHDFNNLLTVIRGNAQMLQEAAGFPSDLRQELDEIAQAADRAATLTRQLLAFSRQQVLEPRVLDLNAVLGDVWKLLERVAGESVTMEENFSESLGAVTADPAQIQQVLLNLVTNARDAMPGGGRLLIETSNVVSTEEFANAHAPMTPGEYVRLAVRDTGEGMDVETKARAFEPFFTTKGQGRGTGMGLSSVYGVVKQSGGFIWVESEPLRGSTFTIYLPRTSFGAPVGPVPSAAASPEHRRGTETILVVEDEELVRSITRRTLARAGYRVIEAVNGHEALLAARALGDDLDLVLTDIVMPVMGGRELAVVLNRERPLLAILFMSGYTHEREAHLSSGGGVSHFLHKPFALDELTSRVRLVLDQTAAAV